MNIAAAKTNMAKSYPQKIAELQAEVNRLKDNTFSAEVLLAHSANGASIAEKDGWRVLVRHSPREPAIRESTKVAIFIFINNQWELWAYGDHPRIMSDISQRCDYTTDWGQQYIAVRELLNVACANEQRRIIEAKQKI